MTGQSDRRSGWPKNGQELGVREAINGRKELKESREAQILAAAFEEFAANGYSGARLDNVAKRADVAKGTIYLYFPSKSRLFQAVVRGLIRPIPKDFESYLKSSSASACQLLRDLIARQYSEVVMSTKARAILRMLIAEGGRFPGLSEIYHREVIEPGVRALRLVIEKGIASGEFRQTEVATFPQILAAPAFLAIVWILILGSQFDLNLDAYQAAHVEIVLSGLRKEIGFEVAPLSEAPARQRGTP